MANQSRQDAEKTLYRALVHAVLIWTGGLELVKAAKIGHVRLEDGHYDFYSPNSWDQVAHEYLIDRGLMSGDCLCARLQVPLDDLDDAIDADYEKGIDIDNVVALLTGQLCDAYNLIGALADAGPHFNQRNSHLREEILAIYGILDDLGYVALSDAADDPPKYVWTRKAAIIPVRQPMLGFDYMAALYDDAGGKP
ncbi:hypothetical protein [Alteraurantiacibacter aquimixticola]|uniref:Uncharacterized protein n=1 Tax=Alteraurantiacibacter aquimixticola TaxID=2489173 RepID=A0A4T3F9W3_9SPHN|nr:hypothetical protein [Alteraurantiacibacter aquimixticola]TIX51810.1 hypothetical protein E5222_05030 [Alteraurantiacibacter aquimixticola]